MAQAILSAEGWSAHRDLMGVPATRDVRRLKVRNRSNFMPSLIASKRRAALIKSRRSAAGRRRNLGKCSISDFYKAFLVQSLEQCDQIALAAAEFNFILADKDVSNLF